MINKNRIVPIMKIDLLSLIGTVLGISNVSYTALQPKDVDGNFDLTGSGAAGNFLASQPVKSLDFKTGVTGATVYFCAAYDFEGFKVAGSAVTTATVPVADGCSIYKAVLASGAVTVTAVTPQAE